MLPCFLSCSQPYACKHSHAALHACSGGLVSSDWADMDWAKIGFLVGNTTTYPTGLGLVPWYLPDFTTSKLRSHACSHCKLGISEMHGYQSIGSPVGLMCSCHYLVAWTWLWHHLTACLVASGGCMDMVAPFHSIPFPVDSAGATVVVSTNGTTSAGSSSSNSTSTKDSTKSSAASAAVLSIPILASLLAVIAAVC